MGRAHLQSHVLQELSQTLTMYERDGAGNIREVGSLEFDFLGSLHTMSGEEANAIMVFGNPASVFDYALTRGHFHEVQYETSALMDLRPGITKPGELPSEPLRVFPDGRRYQLPFIHWRRNASGFTACGKSLDQGPIYRHHFAKYLDSLKACPACSAEYRRLCL